MAFYIGSREFDDLQGDIILPTPAHDVESRAGQDGVVVFSQGTRGREFELESEFHINSYASAVSLMADYYLEPSLTHRNIIRDAETYASSVFRFIVLGVNVRIENRIIYHGLRASGRVTVTPAFAVVARWRMIAITV
jgi:hypothetical protein